VIETPVEVDRTMRATILQDAEGTPIVWMHGEWPVLDEIAAALNELVELAETILDPDTHFPEIREKARAALALVRGESDKEQESRGGQ
jgi:hypothetical protein